jgi:cysteinyl-tRNA synthetase
MAKSTRNLVLVSDLLTSHRGAAVRLMLLNRRWQDPWEYDDAQIVAAEELLDRLYAAAGRTHAPTSGRDRVLGLLLRDLDVPAAVAQALGEGGATARALVDLLKLTEVAPDT